MIPVVYIHLLSHPEYLDRSINQAKKRNDVRLIDDSISIKYSKDLDRLKKAYVPMTFNKGIMDWCAMARWFILKEFMTIEGIDLCYYSDSDSMIYCDVSEVFDVLPVADAHYCLHDYQPDFRWVATGCCSYWSINALIKFCDFVLDTYENKLNSLKQKWDWHQKNGPCWRNM